MTSSNSPECLSPEELTMSDGVFLVKLARRAVFEYLSKGSIIKPPKDTPRKLLKYGMTFTTLLKVSEVGRELRGCIGYLQPVEPQAINVINSAIAAATQDPRFPPVMLHELDYIIFEVSVLSPPVVVEVSDRRKITEAVVLGEDGLIAEYGIYKGLLLPEVPVEYCWDSETFLSETCIKAGMSADCWLSNKVKIMKFTAKTFREVSPGGEVIERNLAREYNEWCKTF
ncbi:MAG: TIGR00296 family protein [Desulfurococcales archaeon]|nr:TIGR00296 family protein [Desulfurococcales archaeon]